MLLSRCLSVVQYANFHFIYKENVSPYYFNKVGGFYLKKLIMENWAGWGAWKPLPDSSFALNLCFTDRDPDLCWVYDLHLTVF